MIKGTVPAYGNFTNQYKNEVLHSQKYEKIINVGGSTEHWFNTVYVHKYRMECIFTDGDKYVVVTYKNEDAAHYTGLQKQWKQSEPLHVDLLMNKINKQIGDGHRKTKLLNWIAVSKENSPCYRYHPVYRWVMRFYLSNPSFGYIYTIMLPGEFNLNSGLYELPKHPDELDKVQKQSCALSTEEIEEVFKKEPKKVLLKEIREPGTCVPNTLEYAPFTAYERFQIINGIVSDMMLLNLPLSKDLIELYNSSCVEGDVLNHISIARKYRIPIPNEWVKLYNQQIKKS